MRLRDVVSSLHQWKLVTIQDKETIFMIMNVSISYIEAKESKDGNLQAFEAVNAKGIPENMA